jgi:hypothetical protein
MHYSIIYFVQCRICPKRKRKALFEEFIKNYLYKVEIVLKVHIYLLDFGTCVALIVLFRINVLLFENMVVETEKSLVIGKAAKLRCFKNLKINNLPVIWRYNKKAWMTAVTMEEWLNMFNAKMEKENRNVILFLDNATCHPKVTLSNVKITWLAANATGASQPMDMGVIYTFKSHYRQFLMQSLISNVEESDTSYALERSV